MMDNLDITVTEKIIADYFNLRTKSPQYNGLLYVNHLRLFDEKVYRQCMAFNEVCMNKSKYGSKADDLLKRIYIKRWDSLEKQHDMNFERVRKEFLSERQFKHFDEWIEKMRSSGYPHFTIKDTIILESSRVLSRNSIFERLLYGTELFELVSEQANKHLTERYQNIEDIPLFEVGFSFKQKKRIKEVLFEKTKSPACTNNKVDYTVGDFINNINTLDEIKFIKSENIVGKFEELGILKYSK